jgi:predicted  nucleic acid-binding Zn-ribbon protein
MSYPRLMDHIEVLREKIGRLRDEIAQLLESHAEYRRAGSQGRNEIQAQIAHGQRQERLQAIQQELAQLADLGRRVVSVEQRKAEHRSRLHVAQKAS